MGEGAEEEWPWDLIDMEPDEADLLELQKIVGLAQDRFHRKPVPDELPDLSTEMLDELGFVPANNRGQSEDLVTKAPAGCWPFRRKFHETASKHDDRASFNPGEDCDMISDDTFPCMLVKQDAVYTREFTLLSNQNLGLCRIHAASLNGKPRQKEYGPRVWDRRDRCWVPMTEETLLIGEWRRCMTTEKKRQEEVFEKKRLVIQERDHSTQARVPRKGNTRDGAAVKVSCARSSESLGCKVEVMCAMELAAKITKFFSVFNSPHTTTTRADRVAEVNADR